MADAVKDRIVIEADPAAVMAVIADYESYPEWQGEVQRAEVLERDASGRGERVRFAVDAKVFTASYVLRYTYGEGLVGWTLEESEQLRKIDGAYRLEEVGEGRTQVSFDLEIVPAVPMPGMLRRRAAKRIVESALQGLKERVESAR